MEPLEIAGTYLHTPRTFPDHRGAFWVSYPGAEVAEAIGGPMQVAQVNCVVSHRGAVRGIHFSEVPDGQRKYVSCVAGTVYDVMVDLRIGSPTFGAWHGITLDANTPQCLYLDEGIGHALVAVTEGAVVSYLCSAAYQPAREHGVHPLDPELGIRWPMPVAELILSDRDAAAPTLTEARAAGLLPDFAACGAPR